MLQILNRLPVSYVSKLCFSRKSPIILVFTTFIKSKIMIIILPDVRFLWLKYHIEHIHVISLKRASEILLSFQGGLSKMYRKYRKILYSYEGDFQIKVKCGMF